MSGARTKHHEGGRAIIRWAGMKRRAPRKHWKNNSDKGPHAHGCQKKNLNKNPNSKFRALRPPKRQKGGGKGDRTRSRHETAGAPSTFERGCRQRPTRLRTPWPFPRAILRVRRIPPSRQRTACGAWECQRTRRRQRGRPATATEDEIKNQTQCKIQI